MVQWCHSSKLVAQHKRIAGGDFNAEAWDQESYPSREDVRLAVFLGIVIANSNF